MKNILSILLPALLFAACAGDTTSPTHQVKDSNGLTLVTGANPEWQYENLRIYPVVADASMLERQAAVQRLKTLAEGMRTPGFRITELKQFGRTREHSVNALTVQNKSLDTFLLLSGDVVTGGNQDRVIAQDQVVAPGTVRNIEVFCVEKGRWRYDDTNATGNEKNIYAFKGYYNVASLQVRRAVQRTGDQQAVWAAVGKITSANNAESGTHTYAALETANEAKAKRDAYLRYFDGKFAALPGMVGMVVVCGDRVLGVDIFGHPDLFRRQYDALLHGYVAEAATETYAPVRSDAAAQQAFAQVACLMAPQGRSTENAGKFALDGGIWVHLYSR
ncbi:MAG: hypothetical protein DYG98_10610 [Haliscomenobacteraceae bacterium CHB4]|nr:hypothetical protein [Haliscomenobacteraceae bacterium CHB4]